MAGTSCILLVLAPCKKGERIGKASVPRRSLDALRPPEGLGVLGDMQHIQPGRYYGVDDLSERPLPLHRPPGREGVVLMAAAEVAAIRPDSGPILVPGPQRHHRVGLINEQVPRWTQQPGRIPGPGSEVPHPDQRPLPRVHQVSTLAAERNAR